MPGAIYKTNLRLGEEKCRWKRSIKIAFFLAEYIQHKFSQTGERAADSSVSGQDRKDTQVLACCHCNNNFGEI
jgi:hypothetical protein